MSSYFTYTNLPGHQVAIYHDEEEKFVDGSRPVEGNFLSLLITGLCTLLLVLTFPISVFFCVKVLRDYEKAVVFRLGRLLHPKGPGVVFIIPCLDKWTRIDMRARAFNVPPQKVHTKDDGWVMVGADVQFRIRDPVLSQTAIQDMNHSMRMLAQSALVNCLASKTILQVQSDRKFVDSHVKESVNRTAVKWGAEVERVQMSEVQVLKEAQDAGGVNIAQMFAGGQEAAITSLLQGLFPALGGKLPRSSTQSGTASVDKSVLTPAQLVTLVSSTLDEDLIRNLRGTYLFRIVGENGGSWLMDLRSGSGSITATEKPSEDPDVVLTMSVEEMINIFYGQITPFNAYMQGSLKVEGDLKMAMNLKVIIEKIKRKRSTSDVVTRDHSGMFVV